ncbi:MAG: phosphatase PAP2 family protein [Gallionellaceae bacterium]
MTLISKSRLTSIFGIALLMLISTRAASAAETPSFIGIIGDDFKYVATAPARWESPEWQTLGWATLAVAGTSIIADRPVRDFMRQQPRNNAFLDRIENFGATYAIGVMGGFYLAGVIGENEKSVNVAQDLVAASLVSATINQTIKVATNRYRPRDNRDIYNFQGYTGLNNNSSFPSGHTTEAFTLASVIASHYEETWVSYTVYSVAALVGVARMYNDAHYASDVTASAFIGTLVGKSIVHHNLSLRTKKMAMLPIIAPDYAGVQVVGVF